MANFFTRGSGVAAQYTNLGWNGAPYLEVQPLAFCMSGEAVWRNPRDLNYLAAIERFEAMYDIMEIDVSS